MAEILYYSLGKQDLVLKPIVISLSTSREVVHILELPYENLTSMRDGLIVEYGILWYEEILLNSIWQSKSIVSFSDFCEFPNIKNNFHLLFSQSLFSDLLQTQHFYIRFAKEQPEIEKRLLEIFSKGSQFDERSSEDMALLYEAYTIMISYDEVATNHILFH